MSPGDALPIFHLGLIVGQLGGSRDLVKRDQHEIRRHYATVEPVDLAAALDAAHHPDFVADHFGFDFCNEIFLQPESVGRSSYSHFRTPPASPRYVACLTFRGDLQAACKRKSGNSLPYNHVVWWRSASGTTGNSQLRCVPMHGNQHRGAT